MAKNIKNDVGLKGKPLILSKNYPIVVESGIVRLDISKFCDSIDDCLQNKDKLAAFELCYIGQLNGIETQLPSDKIYEWRRLLGMYFKNYSEDVVALRNSLFDNFAKVVLGLGATINSQYIEIVLHDIRNPLHSIVQIVNPISNRKIGDAITDFGLKLILEYNRGNVIGTQTNYEIININNKNRRIKGTTIPLHTNNFGLFGFLCVNIDIEVVKQDELYKAVTFIDESSIIHENIVLKDYNSLTYTTSSEVIQEVHILIAKNRIKKVIDVLKKYVSTLENEKFCNNLIMIEAEYNRLQEEIIANIVEEETKNVKMQRIINSIISLMDLYIK